MIWYSEVGQMSEMVKTEQAKEEGFRLVIVTGMSATTIVAMAHRHTQPMHARGRMACQNDLKMRHSARM